MKAVSWVNHLLIAAYKILNLVGGNFLIFISVFLLTPKPAWLCQQQP